MELKRYFGYSGVLNGNTAQEVWSICNQKLSGDDMCVRNILKKSNVTLICTTDDPIDSLEGHIKIAKDRTFDIHILPTWRPDNVMNLESGEYLNYINLLSESAGIKVENFNTLMQALTKRMDFFTSIGCVASDHGFKDIIYTQVSEK